MKKIIVLICVVMVIAAVVSYSVLPMSVVPSQSKDHLLLLCRAGNREIQLSENQTEEIFQLISDKKAVGTMVEAFSTGVTPSYYFVFTFQDGQGVTYATRGISIGPDGVQDNYVVGYKLFASMYRKIVNGDDLFQATDLLMKSWGY